MVMGRVIVGEVAAREVCGGSQWRGGLVGGGCGGCAHLSGRGAEVERSSTRMAKHKTALVWLVMCMTYSCIGWDVRG